MRTMASAQGVRNEGVNVGLRELKDGWHIGSALQEEVTVRAAWKHLSEIWGQI